MNRYQFFQKIDWFLVLLGGNHKREYQYYLFTIPSLALENICGLLWDDGWGTNLVSTTFRGEIYTIRKPCRDNQHQYHIRLYQEAKGIALEGHYETDPLQFPAEHKDSIDLRPMNKQEIKELWRLLCQ